MTRFDLTMEGKSALIYYLTENDKAEARAEKDFNVCNNDDEKRAYLNLVLESYDKMSELHLEKEFVEKLKLKDISEKPVFGNFDLKKFSQKLDLDQLRYGPLTDKDIENAVSSLITLPTLTTDSKKEKLSKNTIKYRCLIESGQLDQSQGSHKLIVDGKVVRYGSKVSGEEYEELSEKYPGMLYAPVIEERGPISRFSSIKDDTKNK
ncbi:hypothetical protein Glove_816420g4 [Diversispora epigaea]|uniref:Uncharacterized protein n=1 Tax=Diversispora epigaea TaxID=1348612 RepID=A0A397G525_9GLOM|nr:hypothetical protein Glove_816420g4 [Diversispora epigaea]